MEPKELTQARRDVITELLHAYGYKATLDTLTGHAFKDGHIVTLAHDPAILDLLPYLSTIQEEMNFQRRMKFVSTNGRPPVRKSQIAHANEPEGLPPELLRVIEVISGGRPAPRKETRPHASNRTQGQLFEEE